jgi:hypothetical protein
MRREATSLRSLFYDVKSFGSFGGAAIAAAFGIYSLIDGDADACLIMLGLACAFCALGVIGAALKKQQA